MPATASSIPSRPRRRFTLARGTSPVDSFARRALAFALFLLCAVSSFAVSADEATAHFDAISAYDEGRYEDALAAIDREKHGSGLAYLRLRVLAELGRFGEALDGSKDPDKAWPVAVVRDLAELRISWAASAGRCDAVVAQGKGSPSRAADRLVARCAFAAKQYAQVKQLLAAAKDDEGRALFIRSLIELGERDAAKPLARAFYVDNPAHRDAELFQQFLEGEGKLVLTLDERIRRAEGLLAARQPDAAYEELDHVPKSTDKKLEARLWHLRGESLFRTRKRYPEANKAFEHAAKLGSDTQDYDVFHAARATSRAGDDRTAIKSYRAFAARYKNSKLTPDALFLAAWLSAREKLPSASADLKSFVASKYASQAPGLRRDALWELGFHAFQKHVPKEANKWLGEYERAVKEPLERARAVYWQGRTALLEKDQNKARALFTRALHEDRLGWYAQLAARRLIALGDPPPKAFEAAPSALPKPAVKAVPEEVRFYHDLGLYSDAADAASRFLGPESDRARRAAVLSEAGEANRLFVAAEPLFDRALEGPAEGARTWIWDALLPKPYWRVVREQTERQAVDPELFYGHMQVESHYKARAISSADALGLMQLLPETALTVAKSLGIDSNRSGLMRPHLNITLGAAYLSSLIKQYNGQYPMAIAAYNAGTHKVDEWTGKKDVELDVWVETIPVEQTRNYVRRVVSAWSRYHALGTPGDAWGLPLPEKVRLHTE